jgi:2-phospho-L-lactate guanylyltransferase
VIAAVPVKDLAAAKQRLARVLSPAERAALAAAMLADVLGALAGAGLDAVWVVTRDPDVERLAREGGAEVLREDDNRGHTAAVTAAQARAAEAGVGALLTVPGDVPCLTPAEARALADAVAGARAAVALAPSRSRLGTNGVALAPPHAMPLRFGEPSFERHLATARGLGLPHRVLALSGLGLDVDDPADLLAVLREGRHTRSGRLLAGWGLDARLEAARAATAP